MLFSIPYIIIDIDLWINTVSDEMYMLKPIYLIAYQSAHCVYRHFTSICKSIYHGK